MFPAWEGSTPAKPNFSWGNLNDPSVTVDRESYRHARILKQNLLRVAQALITEGEPEKAATVMDTCLYYFPYEKIHYDIIMMPFIEIFTLLIGSNDSDISA